MAMVGFRVCGPKLSVAGIVLSVWGIIQLGIMGLAFHYRNVAFIEDLPLNETADFKTPEILGEAIDESYAKLALNCGVAASFYVVTLLLSLHQYWLNNRYAVTAYQRQY